MGLRAQTNIKHSRKWRSAQHKQKKAPRSVSLVHFVEDTRHGLLELLFDKAEGEREWGA